MLVIIRSSYVVMILLLLMGFSIPSAIAQQPPPCPTYQTHILIIIVDSIPQHVTVGGTVVTKIHVVYPDGSPVTLVPETVSFLWAGVSSQKIVQNAVVVPTGDPGFYLYTQVVADDFPTGAVVVWAVNCSCSDTYGNYGPPGDTDSDLTLTPADNSILLIGPFPTGPPTPTELFITYTVPIIIAILLILALLLLFFRSRRKKT